MSYSVTNLKADLTGVLHGTSLSQITGIDNLIYRAGRSVLLDVDPQETQRIAPLASAVFNNVFDYAIPVDLKGNKIIDIRKQVGVYPNQSFVQEYSKQFNQNKTALQNQFNVQFNSGIKTIRIADSDLPAGTIINSCDSATANGTWAVGGTASNLTTNNTNYVTGSSSLQFDATTGAAYLQNSTMAAVDLSTLVNQGHFFVWVYMPTASQFTDVKLRWGSSPTAYYEQTVTVTQQGTAFQNGWNLLDFAWLGANVTGSPVTTAIDTLRVTCDVTAAQTAIKLDSISCRLGTIMEMVYYSSYLFSNATTGVWQETVLDDSDIVNLATESYNLLLNKLAFFAAQQQQGVNATAFDAPFFKEEYMRALTEYRNMYKSEIQKPQNSYYQTKRPGYGKYINYRNP